MGQPSFFTGVKEEGQPEVTHWATRTPMAPSSWERQRQTLTLFPVHRVQSARLQDKGW